MLSKLRHIGALLAVAFCAGAALPAHAGPYSSLTVFGDSLSDTGNVFLATGGAVPGAPYFNGRFSDGPVWVDVLAAGLGLPAGAVPAFAGGSNYAFGGARTGVGGPPPPGTPPGLLGQIGGLWAPANPLADPTGLYVVLGGGNDMRDARAAGSTDGSRQAAAQAAAANIFTGVSLLASRGATKVMISTLPDLGATPEAALFGLVAQSTDASQRYNAQVAGLEALLEGLFPLLDVLVFDMAALAADIRDDAANHGGAEYGLTNYRFPCAPFPGNQGAACSDSLFSDALHPSAAAHAIIGRAALAAVPLPASVPLVLLGLALVGLQRRRRTA